jgi:hypothetical protein
MVDTNTWLLDVRADCDDCDWNVSGKNAMGLAAQHAEREGHEVGGEFYKAFEMEP